MPRLLDFPHWTRQEMDSIVFGHQGSLKAAVVSLHFSRLRAFDRQDARLFEQGGPSELPETLQSAAWPAGRQVRRELRLFAKKSISCGMAKDSLLLQGKPLIGNAA
jgi:hypothetical protein